MPTLQKILSFIIAPLLILQFHAAVATDVDNSIVNQRDRKAGEPTAQDQSNSKNDIDLTRKIRKALMEQDSLSNYAKNIKIISGNGSVVLKGPVASAREKQQLERIATSVAGASKVINQIEIIKQ